jgi:alpha-beta hydrolase superfamily lysophospholipase
VVQEHSFRNGAGYRIAATLYIPREPGPWPVVVFAHGLRSGRRSPRSLPIAEALIQAGIAAFLFDFTGHGDSEGTFDESTFARQVDDLLHAVTYARALAGIDGRRWGLNGASSGGAVAVAVAVEEPPLALVLRGPRLDDVLPLAGRLTCPTLIIQGELDPLLPISGEFYQRLACTRDLKVIRGADHIFQEPRAFQEALELTVNWFSRYLAVA